MDNTIILVMPLPTGFNRIATCTFRKHENAWQVFGEQLFRWLTDYTFPLKISLRHSLSMLSPDVFFTSISSTRHDLGQGGGGGGGGGGWSIIVPICANRALLSSRSNTICYFMAERLHDRNCPPFFARHRAKCTTRQCWFDIVGNGKGRSHM